MKVGVPKESVEGERRVGLVPEGVPKLSERGVEVLVEAGAGRDYNLDDAYREAGAEVVADAERLWAEVDLVAKVRAPAEAEVARARQGQLVVSLLPPVPSAELIRRLTERGVTAVSMDAIPRIARAQSMDALSSQSSVAGYKCILLAANVLGKYLPMMTTAAGTTKAAKVLVLGAGVAGLQSIATARRLGAEVSAFDIRPETKEQVASLGAQFLERVPEQRPQPASPPEADDAPRSGLAGLWDELKLAFGASPGGAERKGGAAAASSDGEGGADDDESSTTAPGGYAREQPEEKQRRDREMIKRHLAAMDVVITTALVPGRPAPKLLTADMVEQMPPGSVVVDLAAEAGGNCELTRVGETVEHKQVRILGPRDVASGVPVHASQFYSRNVVNLLSHLMDDDGRIELDFDDEITDAVVVSYRGEVRHEAVREALGQTAEAAAQT
jgi:H+-translocating NAD(P) transhydrogenase subunit alpha